MDVSTKDIGDFLSYVGFFITYGAGIVFAIDALLKVRTSQGAMAWIIALVTLPFLAIPFYLIFGNRRLVGYIKALRRNKGDARKYYRYLDELTFVPDEQHPFSKALCHISDMPATRGNSTHLLVDGAAAFDRMFNVMEEARVYILIQFYIIRDDDVGKRLRNLLLRKAQEGVKIYLIYDDIGSHQLKRVFINSLRQGGIEVYPFQSTRLRSNRFQVNFRNHRKLVVVDGDYAFLGGLNVGNEYVGRDKRLSPWRDTQLELRGPSVICMQFAFLEDWLWVANETPQLAYKPKAHPEDEEVLILPTGPADDFESCGLFFVETINNSQKRLWIASPYFVPDLAVFTALHLAVLRGVEVRLLVPKNSDNLLVKFASQYYLEMMSRAGVKVYEYQDGFMHQKAMLIDDNLSVVGSANFDNRSFRLNFEILATMAGSRANQALESMFLDDFAKSKCVDASHWRHRGLFFRLVTRFARLFAPIL